MAVYFIQADGVEGPVKIGKATHPETRLRQIQSCNHALLKIIRLLDGGYPEEMWLCEHFRPLWIRDEWFKFSHEMLSVCVPAGLSQRSITWRRPIAAVFAIREIEDAAHAKGIPVKDLPKAAGVHDSTWDRWRKGEVPAKSKGVLAAKAFVGITT